MLDGVVEEDDEVEGGVGVGDFVGEFADVVVLWEGVGVVGAAAIVSAWIGLCEERGYACTCLLWRSKFLMLESRCSARCSWG